jgi:hypothetical protein
VNKLDSSFLGMTKIHQMPSHQPFSFPIERYYVLTGLLILLVLYAPYWLLGQDVHFLIHDFLDDSSYNFNPLVQSGRAFSFAPDATVPNLMNGLPRSAMHSGLYVSVWLFALLPPFWAILLNFLLVHAIGFVGMYALTRTYFAQTGWQAVGAGLLFGLIPTYTNYGLSVMGQPLLLLAFLHLLNGRANPRGAGWGSWIIVLAFPFYSFLVRSGLYILAGLALLGLIDALRNRRIQWPYWLGVIVLAGLYVLADFPMIRAFLTGAFVSHRSEYDPAALVSGSLIAGLKNAVLLFVQGHYHSGIFCPLPIALLWGWWFVQSRERFGWPFWVMVAILAICLLHGIYPWLLTHSGIPQKLLTVFQLDRFYFLLPLLWVLLYNRIVSTRRYIFLAQLALLLFLNKEYRTNARALMGLETPANLPSYRAFFAEDLFQKIKATLPSSPGSYRVVSIGMHPIVAQVNGFFTLDSYQNNYPLPYKHQFRQIMADEWAKPEATQIRPYFDAYGNRCYVFPAELGMNCLIGKTENRTVQDLRFNTAAFRAMGGRYVLSAVEIKNAASLGWRQVGVFNNPKSYWRVWVYAV